MAGRIRSSTSSTSCPEYVNGEPVICYRRQAANTDGDSLCSSVTLKSSPPVTSSRRSAIRSSISAKGGKIQGVIDGLNHMLDLAVAEYPIAGRDVDRAGPRAAVGHSRCGVISQHAGDDSRSGWRFEEARRTLQQVKAARPTLRFRRTYGSTTGSVDDRACSSRPWKDSVEETRMRRLFLIAAAAAVLTASTALAHHSFAATYETGKSIKLEGEIVQFVYRNPHSFVHVDAPDASGVSQRWAVEWGGTDATGAGGSEARFVEGRR